MLHLWPYAQCALVGFGAPPISRAQLPQFIAPAAPMLVAAAGDVCSRMYNRAAEPVEFSGSDRLIAVDLAILQSIPVVIAVAAGPDKVGSIIVGARAGYFNQLVTDPQTAESILTRTRTRAQAAAEAEAGERATGAATEGAAPTTRRSRTA